MLNLRPHANARLINVDRHPAPPGLETRVAHTVHVELQAGRCFFREGEAGQSMFVLERGRVSVRKELECYLRDLKRAAAGFDEADLRIRCRLG